MCLTCTSKKVIIPLMKLNEFIKQLRKQLGLTQTGFGVLIGKDRSTVAKYELGIVIPPGNILVKIQEIETNSQSQSQTD